jgi:hypothetical protein
MASLLLRRNDGRVLAVAAAAWSLFDALVHVAVDQVEPVRIAGNLAGIAAAALVVLLDRFGGGTSPSAAPSARIERWSAQQDRPVGIRGSVTRRGADPVDLGSVDDSRLRP